MKLNKLVFMLLALPSILFAQHAVTGTVTDDLGGPIPSAAVVVVGTSNGTVTDFDGNYTITAKDGDVIEASFAGNTATGTVAGARLDLQILPNQIDEVVVTSFGREQKKKSLGYAMQQVKAADIQVAGSNNALQDLQGQVSGLNIQKTSGGIGGGIDMLIRGTTQLGGDNQPLIIIDGTPLDNSTFVGDLQPSTGSRGDSSQQFTYSNRSIDINPDDIASYSVLKGAAASALYGLRAANGAIIITTKRAKSGGVKVNFATSYTSSSVNMYPELNSKYREGYAGAAKLTMDPNNINISADQSLFYNRSGYYHVVDNIPTPFHTWGPLYGDDPSIVFHDTFRDFFRTGTSKNINANVTGGSEKANVYFSFANGNKQGIVPNTYYKKTSLKLKGNFKILNKLVAETSVTYTASNSLRASNGQKGVMNNLAHWSPSFSINDWENPDGSHRRYTPWLDNARFLVEYSNLKNNLNRTLLVGKLVYPVTDNFTVTFKGNRDHYKSFSNRFGEPTVDFADNVGGFVINQEVEFTGLNSTLLAEYAKKITEDFNFSLMVGHQIDDTKLTYDHEKGEGLIDPRGNSLYNATTIYNYDTAITQKRVMGVFSELKLDYKDFVFLSLTGRNDWASTLPKENRSVFYPSANLSFVFSDLVAKDSDTFSFGKLRLSWASVGNIPSPHKLDRYYYNSSSFPFGGATSGTYLSSSTYDRDLHPVLTTTKEVGFDLRFFDNRFKIDYAYYDQFSNGQINYLPLANSSSASQVLTNAGDIRTTGHELLLSADIIRKKDFKWNATINWNTSESIVESLPFGFDEIVYATHYYSYAQSKLKVGGHLGDLYAYAYKYENGQLYIGANGKPQVDFAQGQVYFGNAFPDWVGSLSNSLTYKNLNLSFNVEYKSGGQSLDTMRRAGFRAGNLAEQDDRYETVVLEGVMDDGSGGFTTNTNTLVKDEGYYRSSGAFTRAGENLIKDTDWIKLRNISLTYRLPKELVKKAKLTRASISVSGSNFMLWTPYDRFDPEGSDYAPGTNIYGFTGGNIPLTQNVSVGLKIGF